MPWCQGVTRSSLWAWPRRRKWVNVCFGEKGVVGGWVWEECQPCHIPPEHAIISLARRGFVIYDSNLVSTCNFRGKRLPVLESRGCASLFFLAKILLPHVIVCNFILGGWLLVQRGWSWWQLRFIVLPFGASRRGGLLRVVDQHQWLVLKSHKCRKGFNLKFTLGTSK